MQRVYSMGTRSEEGRVRSAPMFVTLSVYGISTILYLVYLAFQGDPVLRWAKRVFLAAAILNFGCLLWCIVQGEAPDLFSVSWFLVVGILAAVWLFQIVALLRPTSLSGAMLSAAATLVLATLMNNAGKPLPHREVLAVVTPAHIAASAIGFVGFGVAFVASLAMLVADLRLRQRWGMGWPRVPSIETLDRISRLAVRIGFPFYTVGILLGAIWGLWEGEAGSLLTPEYLLGVGSWLVFASLVYAWHRTGWRGRKAAVLVIVGFLGVSAVVLMYAMRRI